MKFSSCSLTVCILILSLVLMISTSCKSSSSQSRSSSNQTASIETLEDMLRKQSGLMVIGSGNNLSIRIRGNSSIMGDNNPLFIIDGVPVGTHYPSISASIVPTEIQSIRVLSGAKAAIYGARGSNGVILVDLKK